MYGIDLRLCVPFLVNSLKSLVALPRDYVWDPFHTIDDLTWINLCWFLLILALFSFTSVNIAVLHTASVHTSSASCVHLRLGDFSLPTTLSLMASLIFPQDTFLVYLSYSHASTFLVSLACSHPTVGMSHGLYCGDPPPHVTLLDTARITATVSRTFHRYHIGKWQTTPDHLSGHIFQPTFKSPFAICNHFHLTWKWLMRSSSTLTSMSMDYHTLPHTSSRLKRWAATSLQHLLAALNCNDCPTTYITTIITKCLLNTPVVFSWSL